MEQFIPHFNEYVVAIYCRLSSEDKKYGTDESLSIKNQEYLLREFCKKNGWKIYDVYKDDGVSGTTFDRKNFQRMLKDIESKKVNLVITKDQSRLGREHVFTDYYMEHYFPLYNIRYIALEDNYDSDKLFGNEIAPYRNLNNEFHASATSKKVRDVWKIKAEQGEHFGQAPYGYYKRDETGNLLHIDVNAAKVVKMIYDLFDKGYGYKKISKNLRKKKIIKPSVYFKYNKIMNLSGTSTVIKAMGEEFNKEDYDWHQTTIKNILENRTYKGDTVNNQSHTVSFKVHKKIKHDAKEWKIKEKTHIAIISDEQWFRVQESMKVRKREQKNGERQIFSGILRCADCGYALSYTPDTRNREWSAFQCTTYKNKGKEYCNSHRISYNKIYSIVLKEIQKYTKLINENERAILVLLNNVNLPNNKRDIMYYENEILKHKRRIEDIVIIYKKIYEDKVLGNIDAERFNKLASSYSKEQETIEESIKICKDKISELENKKDNQQQFINILKKYKEVTRLDYEILHDIIDKIEIGMNNGKNQYQKIKIYFKFIGYVEQAQEYKNVEVKAS